MPDNAPPPILLTRPRAASETFARGLRDRLGAVEIIVAPLMEVTQLAPPPEARAARSLIFTSQNAIPQAGPGAGRTAWCVGRKTAEAAEAAGFKAVSVDGTADDLVARLSGTRPEKPLWHLHGRHVRGDVAARLRARGLAVETAEVYDQRAVTPSATFQDAIARPTLIVPLFSPRSAQLFAAAAASRPAPPDLVVISAATREALPENWQGAAHVARAPNATAMRDAVAETITRRIGI